MGFEKKSGKRSPLKQPLLRQAGQSLSAERDRIIQDKLLSYVLTAFFFVMLAAFEWWKFLRKLPPQPVSITLVALAFSCFALYRYFSIKKCLSNIRLGINGEKTVAQFLEVDRDSEWRILNDIPSDRFNSKRFNIDHVVVTPKGIFVVETKTKSKLASGETKVTFDGEFISINGRKPDSSPVIQVRAARDWMKEFLKSETGKTYPVKGVVVIPGWFVEGIKNWKASDVWVLNHKALPAFIRNEKCDIANEDIHLAVARIADHMQRSDKSA
jgi:hypothetical protein